MSSSSTHNSGSSSRTTEDSQPPTHPKCIPKNEPFNAYRPVRVILIGAGITGIAAAILLPKKVLNLEYMVYEKNKTVGGTWAENVYPGVRCDVPSHMYQLAFAPNLKLSECYPKGAKRQ